MSKIKLAKSDIWTATDEETIGSKINNEEIFNQVMIEYIKDHDSSKDRAEGQHFIVLSHVDFQKSEISCGVGLNTIDQNDYILRLYRGRVQPFLKREHALPCSWCAVIVYTRSAYLDDADISEVEKATIESGDCTHVLVALLANADGVPNAYSTTRFVSNLAGGNKAFSTISIEELREMAKDSIRYTNTWCVVAD